MQKYKRDSVKRNPREDMTNFHATHHKEQWTQDSYLEVFL